MIYEKKDRLISRQIDTMVLTLEDFSPDRIIPLNKAHKANLDLLPASLDKTAMISQFVIAVDYYEKGITLRNIDISGRGEDVVLFNEQEKLVGKQVSAIKRKVIEINDNKAALVLFNLTNVDYYTKGHQSDVQKRINELLIKMTSRPEYITVLPFVEALQDNLGSIFDLKTSQKTLVRKDREDIDPLVQVLKEAYIFDKGILQKIYCKDITKTFCFFPLDIMYGAIERAENYVTKQQAFITNPSDYIINIPSPAFTKTNLIEIENLGPEPIQAYKLIVISPLIPETAVTIAGFSTFKGNMMDLGPDTAKNLMLGFPGALNKVKVRITIKPRKRKK